LGLLSLFCAAHAVCAGPPAIVSLTPDSGTGTVVTFQAVYSDPNGASDLNEISAAPTLSTAAKSPSAVSPKAH
jgi:hypothetical protein